MLNCGRKWRAAGSTRPDRATCGIVGIRRTSTFANSLLILLLAATTGNKAGAVGYRCPQRLVSNEKKVNFYEILSTHWTRIKSKGPLLVGDLATYLLRRVHGMGNLPDHDSLGSDPLTKEKMRKMQGVGIRDSREANWKTTARRWGLREHWAAALPERMQERSQKHK